MSAYRHINTNYKHAVAQFAEESENTVRVPPRPLSLSLLLCFPNSFGFGLLDFGSTCSIENECLVTVIGPGCLLCAHRPTCQPSALYIYELATLCTKYSRKPAYCYAKQRLLCLRACTASIRVSAVRLLPKANGYWSVLMVITDS